MTPNWRQFSRIPWDSTVADVMRVLAVDVPPEGRPASFICGGFIAAHTSAGLWVVMGPEGGSHALRKWLEMWAS